MYFSVFMKQEGYVQHFLRYYTLLLGNSIDGASGNAVLFGLISLCHADHFWDFSILPAMIRANDLNLAFNDDGRKIRPGRGAVGVPSYRQLMSWVPTFLDELPVMANLARRLLTA